MKQTKRNRYFTFEEKLAIINEYEQGSITMEDLCLKYGIGNASSISKWRRELQNGKKSLSLCQVTPLKETKVELPALNTMAKKKYETPEEEIAALRAQLRQVQKDLDWEQKRNLALETLIEVAEEHGMPVKKCGAKQ